MPRGVYDRSKAKPRGPRKKKADVEETRVQGLKVEDECLPEEEPGVEYDSIGRRLPFKHEEIFEAVHRHDELTRRGSLEEELGETVTVVTKPKAVFRPIIVYSGQVPLEDDHVSLQGSAFSFGEGLSNALVGKYLMAGELEGESETRLGLRIMPQKQLGAYVVVRDKGKAKFGTPALMKKLVELGYPLGRYRAREVKGGYVLRFLWGAEEEKE